MSWSFKFYAGSKEEIHLGLNRHLAENLMPVALQTEMLRAVDRAVSVANQRPDDAAGIGWIVESFGHIGDGGGACNFTFKLEPINTTHNQFYRSKFSVPATPEKKP